MPAIAVGGFTSPDTCRVARRDDAKRSRKRWRLYPNSSSEQTRRSLGEPRYIRKTEAYRTSQSSLSRSNGSRPQYWRGQPRRNDGSPSWISSIRSVTGRQPCSEATLLRTARSTPDTKRYPSFFTRCARLRNKLLLRQEPYGTRSDFVMMISWRPRSPTRRGSAASPKRQVIPS